MFWIVFIAVRGKEEQALSKPTRKSAIYHTLILKEVLTMFGGMHPPI
jgi:hypothetical protein